MKPKQKENLRVSGDESIKSSATSLIAIKITAAFGGG